MSNGLLGISNFGVSCLGVLAGEVVCWVVQPGHPDRMVCGVVCTLYSFRRSTYYRPATSEVSLGGISAVQPRATESSKKERAPAASYTPPSVGQLPPQPPPPRETFSTLGQQHRAFPNLMEGVRQKVTESKELQFLKASIPIWITESGIVTLINERQF